MVYWSWKELKGSPSKDVRKRVSNGMASCSCVKKAISQFGSGLNYTLCALELEVTKCMDMW